MRFASCLFVGVAVLLVACVGLTSLQHRDGAAVAPASCIVSEGNPAALRRLEAKNAVTRRLLDGELTLLEAAAWFRYVNQTTGAAGPRFYSRRRGQIGGGTLLPSGDPLGRSGGASEVAGILRDGRVPVDSAAG